MTTRVNRRRLGYFADLLALLVTVPAVAQDRNPQRQAEEAQTQARIATLEQQVLDLRLAMGELQVQLAQVQAKPLGPSNDLVIGSPTTESITILTRHGSIRIAKRVLAIKGDLIDLSGEAMSLSAKSRIDITGSPVNVKASSDLISKGSKVREN